MNERIQELREQARTLVSNEERDRGELYEAREQWERCDQKFAELIVRECAKFLDENSGYDNSNNAWHPEPEDLLKHFGVEECRGWVCPKCGVDRTKDVCPQGHMAAVEGKCPMIGVAQ